jgi:hypothetical protein
MQAVGTSVVRRPTGLKRAKAAAEATRHPSPPVEQEARAVLDSAEQAVMDHILAAMRGIQDFGLETNSSELTQAIHVLQAFVIQHMLQRIEPEQWGRWYA